MRKHWIGLLVAAVVLGGAVSSAHAVILKSVSVDFDGDCVAETLYYCVGNPGEPNQPYVYAPFDFLAGFARQVTRCHFGMFSLREVVIQDDKRVLDTGLPVLVNEQLVIQDPLYQSRETVILGDSIVTTWIQGDVRLVRYVWMNDRRMFVEYNAFYTGGKDPIDVCNRVIHAGFIAPWSRDRQTFQADAAYVDSVWTQEYADLHHLFPPGQIRNGWELQLSYGFDDWLEIRTPNYFWGWDDWMRAIMGTGFLPDPDTLFITGNHEPCEERANVIWTHPGETSTCAVNAAPVNPEILALLVPRAFHPAGAGKAMGEIKASPNPFASFASVPGHEAERFVVYDVSGRMVGTYQGGRIGEGLSPGVYLMRSEAGGSRTVRIVKTR